MWLLQTCADAEAAIAQLANSGQPIAMLVVEDATSIATEFINHLRLLLPAADDAAIHDGYLHLVAATLHT